MYPALAVKVTLPPWQSVVLPDAVIVDAVGVVTTTVTGAAVPVPAAVVAVHVYVPEVDTVID